jgi:hypothetical protein
MMLIFTNRVPHNKIEKKTLRLVEEKRILQVKKSWPLIVLEGGVLARVKAERM